MRTTVRIRRGRYGGRSGWIAGDLHNLGRGITKALVHLDGDVVVLIELSRLEAELPLETQKRPAAGAGAAPTAGSLPDSPARPMLT